METRVVDLYLSRIMCGYYLFLYANKRYKLQYPDISLKYQADILAQQAFEENKYQEWPTLTSIVDIMVDLGLWEYHYENDLKRLESTIEDIKVEMFKNWMDPKKLKTFKKVLYQHTTQYEKLYSQKHAFDHITIDMYAESIKSKFLLSNGIYDENDELLFLKNDSNSILFDRLAGHISKNTIPIHVFKQIARSSEWMNYWSAKKDDVFLGPSIQWTDEQKNLVLITKMYQNARESPDCPPEEVFNDDDLFEGWAISQRRKYEKEKKQATMESSLPGKLGKANEVFVMANSQEKIKNIYDMNSAQATGIIKERQKALKGKQNIQEKDLPDVQRDITINSNQQLLKRK